MSTQTQPSELAFNALIVEDDSVDTEILKRKLTSLWENIELDFAATASEALKKLKAKTYGYIFLDLNMPDSIGVEAINSIRQAASQSTSIIVMTGYATNLVIQAALKEGANSVLGKEKLTHDKLLDAMGLA